MIHLHKDIWLTADEYSFSFAYKDVYKSGKQKGEVYYRPFSHHSTSEQVSRKIVDLGLKELVNSDYSNAVAVFEKMHNNFVEGLPKLTKLRYDIRTAKRTRV